MKLRATHLALRWSRDDLASWENEGGAINAAPNSFTMVGWPPASIIDPAPAEQHDADRGITDTNSLTILRISLLLLVPALGSLAIFWGSVVSGSQ